MLLNEIAEYELAVPALGEAAELQQSATIYAARGWAFQYLGPLHAEETRSSYAAGLAIDPEDIWCLKGLGNALSLLGDPSAADHYRRAIELGTARAAKERKVETLSNLAWCHYELGEYDEAVRLCMEVLSRDADLLDAQFDLALVLMCSDRHTLALQEYRRGVSQAEARSALRRRGLLHVAIDDLNFAVRSDDALQKLQVVQDAKRLLDEAFSKVKDLHPATALATV